MAVVIGGKRLWLWRAVDSEGEILDMLVQPRRDKAAALGRRELDDTSRPNSGGEHACKA